MTYPSAPLAVVVEFYDGSTWIDITDYVFVRDGGISIRRGFPDEGSTPEPSSCTLTLDNRDGRFSPRNPMSPYYGLIGRNTPVRVRVDESFIAEADKIRFVGEISEWPVRWDVSEADVWTSVTAQGILRRLGQGRKPTTAAKSTILASAPAQYWPLDDGGNTAIGSSGLPGGPTLAIGEFTPKFGLPSDTTDARAAHPGVGKAVDFFDGGSLTGSFTMPDTGSWSFSMYASLLMTDTSTVTLALIRVGTGTATGDSLYNVVISTSFNGIIVQITGASQMNSTLGIIPDDAADDPTPYHIVVTATQNGSDVDFSLRLDGEEVDTTTLASTTNAAPRYVQVGPASAPPTDSELVLGQVAFFDSVFTDDLSSCFLGYDGETAGARAERLADEAGVSLTLVGDADETERMGVQAPGTTVLDALLDAATTDMALVYESRHELGLTLHTRRGLYNQAVGATLDYTAPGEVAPDLAPTDDDRYTRNDITVRRRGGGSARAVDTTSRMGTADPPTGVGLVAEELELNLYSDDQLPGQAAWRLHLGTLPLDDQARWQLALHETGHVILGLSVGAEIAYATLAAGPGFGGTLVRSVDPWADALVAAGGMGAAWSRAEHDIQAITALGFAARLDEAVAKARRVIARNQPAVIEIATALAERGYLSADDIADLVDVTPRAGR